MRQDGMGSLTAEGGGRRRRAEEQLRSFWRCWSLLMLSTLSGSGEILLLIHPIRAHYVSNSMCQMGLHCLCGITRRDMLRGVQVEIDYSSNEVHLLNKSIELLSFANRRFSSRAEPFSLSRPDHGPAILITSKE